VLARLTPVIAFLLIGLVYYLGIRTERTGFVAEVLDPSLKRITQPVLNAFRGRPPAVYQLLVRISEDRMDSLLRVREDALESGWLHADGNPRFPVQCSFGEYDFDAVLNLRDGPAEDLALRRWPFQLRMREGDTLYTMQSFDLVPVNDMGALQAWIMQQALADLGHPAFAHAMMEVRVNGTDLGLYALEGRVDSTLLARWGRGRGPVIRFDDGLLAGTRAAMANRLYGSQPPPQGDWLVAPIMATRHTVLNTDPFTTARFQRAVQQLEDLRSGRARPSQVFDIPSLARFFALCDVLGGQEATAWWNLRFLADSLSERLIALPQRGSAAAPIASIGALGQGVPVNFATGASGFQERLFNDSTFYRAYVAHLDTFSSPGWLEALMARRDVEFTDRERIISAEYPQASLARDVFEHNRTVIQQTLRPHDMVLAYTRPAQGNQRRLALANVHALPIRAVAVIIGTDTLPLPRPVTLLPREMDKPLSYTVVNLQMPVSEGLPERVLVHVMGLPQELRAATIRTWSTFVAQ
jgi:hypothetical protein